MGHQIRRIPVYNYNQSYGSSPLTAATPAAITGVGQIVTMVKIFDSSGQAIDFMIGAVAGRATAFTIPPGGGEFEVMLHPGMSLWLNAQTSATTGQIVITGYQ